MAQPINLGPQRVSRIVLMLVALAIVIVFRELRNANEKPDPPKPVAAAPGEYLFCFWNVENLFDDKPDKRRPPDEEYDDWFADNAADREKKYTHLAEALVKLNGGKGPDILCVAEVETVRAAELLQQALNAKLPKDSAPYGEPVMKEVAAGRHMAPALLTRLHVVRDRTKGFGTSRILEVHLTTNEKDLVVIAAHWTSQLSDKTGDRRDKYADQIYGRVTAMYKSNPKVDVIVCGDFNDTPDAPAVRDHLHTTDDPAKLNTTDDRPTLLNLMAGKSPKEYGTIFYKQPLVYDHIILSPGMLDTDGWACDPASVQVVTGGLMRPGATRREPWRFGNRKDDHARGYSDHFPVTVKLRVQ